MKKHLKEKPKVNLHKTWHVFTHNQDEWYDTLKEANAQYQIWRKDNGTARLYEELRDADGELFDENCIKSFGEWPM